MKQWLHFNDYVACAVVQREALQRIFFSATLLVLLARYFAHTLIHQIGSEPLLYQEIDPVYWLFMILDLPNFIAAKIPLVFDFMLIGSCLCSIIWNQQNISTILFFITHFVFFVLTNLMTGHHYINIGILFVSFPFVFASKVNFAYALAFVRFLFCFGMFSAGLWKVFRGNLFFPDQIYTQLVSRHLTDILQHKTTMRLSIITWLIQHRYIAHLFWVIMIGIEVSFVAGFISFKYDCYLIIGYLLFAIGGGFLFRLFIYENLIFLLTLAPALKWVGAISENLFKVQHKRSSKPANA